MFRTFEVFKKSFGSLAIIAAASVLAYSLSQLTSDLEIPKQLQDFITLSSSIFVEAFPFLVLGSLLAAAVNTYVSSESLTRLLPNQPLLRRAALSVLGFFFPVCECGNVPLSRSLIAQGIKPADAITFLLAAPVLNPVTIWATWTAFGYDQSIVVSRVIATFLIANIIGYVLSLKKNQDDFLTSDFIAYCKTAKSDKKRGDRFSKMSNYFTHEAFAMLRMLAFGALIAGAIQTFVPRDILVSIGSDVILSIVAMLVLAFVVSICANVDAFFALSFANTNTAGSIVGFLVFGPMIDIKILTLLKTTFKNELIIIVSLLSLIFSILTALVVSYAF